MNLPVNILTRLRVFTPDRALAYAEACSIAERQALRLLLLAGHEDSRVPEQLIADLPRVRVRSVVDLPTSGLSFYDRGLWQIALNGSDAYVRQRFTLAHEFKHVLDHPFAATLYGALDADQIERICDYFAGCLLIPRPALKRAYVSGTQHISALAQQFDVSAQAMRVRLSQTGITPEARRCRSARTYYRSATTVAA